MNEKQIKELKEWIKEEEKSYDFNDFLWNWVNEKDLADIEDGSALREYFEGLNDDRAITNAEVIYYSNAIEYLKENDPSLNESLELAKEMGIDLENINSEVLASLLKTQENENDFYEFLGELESYGDFKLFQEVQNGSSN